MNYRICKFSSCKRKKFKAKVNQFYCSPRCCFLDYIRNKYCKICDKKCYGYKCSDCVKSSPKGRVGRILNRKRKRENDKTNK